MPEVEVELCTNADAVAVDESRIYRCEFCHGWHLTSQPKRVTDG